ncbi:MAG: type IX secretion system sortase PorU [Bacteroidota bacterium]
MVRICFITILTALAGIQFTFAQTTSESYTDQSVLSTGEVYKIGVTRTGMYALDYDFLSGLGINLENIDPRNISLYGNGGGMLPQSNMAYRHDDLQENAILVEGEMDGRFNNNDRVVFYAQGPSTWEYNSNSGNYYHRLHLYADTNYYYLKIGEQAGLRTSELPSEPADYTHESLRRLTFHEEEKENPLTSGRFWLGEKFSDFSLTRRFSFYVPDAKQGGQIRVTARVAARSDVSTAFTMRVGSQVSNPAFISKTNITAKESIYYYPKNIILNVSAAQVQNDSVAVTLVFDQRGSSRSEGWLDWIEVDYDVQPNAQGVGTYLFHAPKSGATGQVAEVRVANAGNGYRLWDITDPVLPKKIAITTSGNDLLANVRTDSSKVLAVFRDRYARPASGRRITNQNLHANNMYDYLLIANPLFKDAAEQLKEFHESHYGRQVLIAYPEQIYNEFSSGKQDVSAIRDFIRMFYVRSGGERPGFVCLLGDGTYDYKSITYTGPSLNFVPTYQSRVSNDPIDSYVSDDFYAMVADDEGDFAEGSNLYGDDRYRYNELKLAIGRLPVETVEEANAMVQKVKDYANNPDGFGAWRNRVVLVADHKDDEGFIHLSQADSYTPFINRSAPCMNVEKVYMDNYPVERNARGILFPEGREALLRQMDEGSLIINYTGHGGEYAWSNSSIFINPDIDLMENGLRMPAVVTATCEYGRYDDHGRRSGAELYTIRPGGGAIALFTTVRLVYSSPNRTLNNNFYGQVFAYDSAKNRMPTIGEIMMRTKNLTFPLNETTDINSRNFSLLGDPGLILAYPEMRAEVTHINERPIDASIIDSLASLQEVEVSGIITNAEGDFQPGYEGEMNVTVLDKPSKFTTKQRPFTFYWQKNRIFNGTSTVKDGEFSFRFVVPIDISYEDGDAKFSLYFHGQEIDGTGCYDNLYLGGTSDHAVQDDQGPQIQLFINDTAWVDGGRTNPDPYIYAKLFDESGINTVGSGIGHEIAAVMNESNSEVIILNNFYEAATDDYKNGEVRYQLRDLPAGEHKLLVRVWDVANNFSEATTSFIVVDDARLALTEVLNYPNPVEDQTRFLIGHNRPGKEFQVQVRITSGTDGRVVNVLRNQFSTGGNYFRDMMWDGRDQTGRDLNPGVYVFEVRLKDMETGEEVSEYSKMVLVR